MSSGSTLRGVALSVKSGGLHGLLMDTNNACAKPLEEIILAIMSSVSQLGQPARTASSVSISMKVPWCTAGTLATNCPCWPGWTNGSSKPHCLSKFNISVRALDGDPAPVSSCPSLSGLSEITMTSGCWRGSSQSLSKGCWYR
jgi:hypothetical protein